MTEFLKIPDDGVIKDKFLEILTSKSEWLDSPEDVIAQAQGESLEYFLIGICHMVNRAAQKLYSSTAMESSTVLAMVQDSGYVPRFASPFKAMARVTNKNSAGGANISYAVEQQLISETDNLFILENPVNALAPGEFVDIEVHQETKTESNHISDGLYFQEFIVGTSDVYKFLVYVDNVLWNQAGLLVSIDQISKVYSIYYSQIEELIIRFGDNVLGKAPTLGATIKIVVYHTSGQDGDLQVGAKLEEYNVTQSNNVGFEVVSVLSQGINQETTDEMAKSLPMYEKSKGALGWSSDYTFAILQGFPDVVWANVWGEPQQEAITGADINNINKIFLSAYREINQAGLGADVVIWLEDQKKPTNIKFSWQEPNILTFNLIITGKVDKNINIAYAEEQITIIINKYYDILSKNRRPSVINKEISEDLDSTGFFRDQLPHLKNRTIRPEFSLSITGSSIPVNLYDMVSIGNLTFNLTPIV